jgi:hypothetical protein
MLGATADDERQPRHGDAQRAAPELLDPCAGELWEEGREAHPQRSRNVLGKAQPIALAPAEQEAAVLAEAVVIDHELGVGDGDVLG